MAVEELYITMPTVKSVITFFCGGVTLNTHIKCLKCNGEKMEYSGYEYYTNLKCKKEEKKKKLSGKLEGFECLLIY
jgi:hypothetical protein